MRSELKSPPKKTTASARGNAPIKRIATVGALTLASILSFVSPASAATDIRGTESWSTDKWFRKRERATFIAGFGQHLTIRALGNIGGSRQHWRMSAVVG